MPETTSPTPPTYLRATTCQRIPMSRWRERGYVQDSDEEDGTDSIPSSPPKLDQTQELEEDVPASVGSPSSSDTVKEGNATPEVLLVAETLSHIPDEAIASSPQERPIDAVDSDSELSELGNDDFDDLERAVFAQTSSNLGNAILAKPIPLVRATRVALSPSVVVFSNTTTLNQTQGRSLVASGNRSNCGEDYDLGEGNVGGTLRTCGRKLRDRIPIQLHPYLIEGERYRQTLKSRGVKPIHLASESSASRPESYTVETQEQEFRPREDTPPSSPVRRRRSGEETSTLTDSRVEQDVSPTYFPLDDDDELPDVEALIRRRVSNRVGQDRTNRRKLVHAYSNKLRVPQKKNSTEIPPSKLPSALNDTSHDIYDIPQSPSSADQVGSPHSKHIRRRFRMPPEQTPHVLPTPVTSSEARNSIEQTVLSESEDNTPPRSVLKSRSRLVRHPTIILESSSNSDLSGSDSGKSDVSLKQAQKKIKGVLPASWLKLDREAQLKRQKPSSPQRHLQQSPERSEPQRGVARKVTRPVIASARPTQSERQRSPAVSISDDSDTAPLVAEVEPSDTPGHRAHSIGLGVRSTMDDSMIDDGLEDNRIDYMLPSTARSRPSGGKRRKRQLTLADSLGLSSKRLRISTTSGHAHSQPKQASSARQHSKKNNAPFSQSRPSKPRTPRLSILDSHHTQVDSTNGVPHFIRLAARQARRQRDGGRQSPSRKAIRLQTFEDTEDANSVLDQWTAGTLQPRNDAAQFGHRRHERRPLMDRVGNMQQRQLPDPLPKPLDTESGRLKAASSRGTGPKSTSKLRQARLDPVAITKLTHLLPMRPDSYIIRKPTPRLHHPQKLFRPPPYRNAQLERLEAEFDLSHRKLAFQRQLSRANLQFSDAYRLGSTTSNPQISRFLADDDAMSIVPDCEPENEETLAPHTDSRHLSQSRVRIPRKRPSRHIDVHVREFRQPSDPPVHPDAQNRVIVIEDSGDLLLKGLGPFGAQYPADFDVFPLEVGTYFHRTTFLGSGELDSCLRIDRRNLDIPVSHQSLLHLAQDTWCSAWNEEVSAALKAHFQDLCGQLDHLLQPCITEDDQNTSIRLLSNISVLLRQVTAYISASLYFLDPIDRTWIVATMSDILENVHNAISQDISKTNAITLAQISRHRARSLSYLLVLSAQLIRIGESFPLEAAAMLRLETLVKRISLDLVNTTVRHGHQELRTYQDDSRRRHEREAGTREDKAYVQSLVIAMQTLECLGKPALGFWDTVNDVFLPKIATFNQVSQFEHIWSDTFVLLPFCEFDAVGVLQVGRRFDPTLENWGFVKAMLNRLFLLYPETSKGRNSSLNTYIRTVMTRCCTLISGWGWKRCECILGAMFDFFAKNKLSLLRHEESQGSPGFLGKLAEYPSLQIQPDDRSFVIFIKCLALGLRGMQDLYPEKKIRGIVYRFIPNHGRTYRRDESIRQEDLDALRNHHDILCTLYWASPPPCRPRLDLLRGLVDHASSHREACRLSVRAWAHLLRFQLSTGEPYESLLPFALWYKDIMEQSITQYRLARTEAESQFENSRVRGNEDISPEILQSTIRKNQNQVLATLRDAVAGLKNAIQYAKDKHTFMSFLEDSSAIKNFGLFDAANSRANELVIETLAVFETQARHWRAKKIEKIIPEDNEESQDYGDVPDFDDFHDLVEDRNQQINDTNPLDSFQTSLWHLLSNCFGAETSPGETILTKAVDTWIALAQLQVDSGRRTWGDYVGSFSAVSWHQLRDTEQSRKFAAYFMSSVLASDKKAYSDCRQDFIAVWVLSLVERESMLKFQHVLTNVLVNIDQQHPLLQNLPFLRESRTGEVTITVATLRERRLGLISTILANMRDFYERTMRDSPREVVKTRSEYTALLKKLMFAMKRNYLELQQFRTSMKGAYIEFAQTVVQFLQQYTQNIFPVDQFFTDSVAFPLPTTDPTYVVGRLGGYSLKLTDSRTTKQLSTFIQTMSERAAVDNQQSYFLKQLCTAMAGAYESGEVSQPTLRHVLLQDIFPAYTEVSLQSASGCIVASPILQATSQVFRDLFYQFSVTDDNSVESCLELMRTTLDVFCQATQLLIDHAGLLEQAHTRHVVALMFEAITAFLPLLDYIHANTGEEEDLLLFIRYFRRLSIFIAETVKGYEAPLAPNLDYDIPTLAATPSPLRTYCNEELGKAMDSNWAKVGNDYFVVRGNTRKEVSVPVRTAQEEGEQVLSAIEGFLVALGRSRGLGGDQQERRVGRRATNLIV